MLFSINNVILSSDLDISVVQSKTGVLRSSYSMKYNLNMDIKFYSKFSFLFLVFISLFSLFSPFKNLIYFYCLCGCLYMYNS